MARAFMYGTRLQAMEQMMMSVPNFSPRGKGMIIMGMKKIDENEEYKRCVYCLEYTTGGCKLKNCPYLMERAELRRIGYADFIKDGFGDYNDFYFKKRLRQLTHSFQGEWFLSPYHKERYSYLKESSTLFGNKKDENLAILFLLTANEELWERAKHHIYPNKIALTEITLKGISTNCYALYQAAKTIATGKSHIEVNELADKDLIGGLAFKTIIHAFMIARYGSDILNITQ